MYSTKSECKKSKFANEQAALDWIKSKSKVSKKKKIVLSTYFCSDCLTWHITSNQYLFKKDFNIREEIIKRDEEIKSLHDELANKSNPNNTVPQKHKTTLKQGIAHITRRTYQREVLKVNLELYSCKEKLQEERDSIGRLKLKIGSLNKLLLSSNLKMIHDKHKLQSK